MKVVPAGDSNSRRSSQHESGPDATRPKAANRKPRLDYVEVQLNTDDRLQQQQQQRAKQAAVYTEVIPSKMRSKAPTADHANEHAHRQSSTDENSSMNARRAIPMYENVQLQETAGVSIRVTSYWITGRERSHRHVLLLPPCESL